MNLRWHFYVQNLDIVALEMICVFLIWTVLMLLLTRKARRIVSIIGAILSIGLILFSTVYRQVAVEDVQISLIPFISFVKAMDEVELYRSMLMNLCLFLPLGLSLPFALFEKFKHNVLITIAFALLLSIGVETVQYFFILGLCETDDVIMNALGASIGTLSFVIHKWILILKQKHIHRHITR